MRRCDIAEPRLRTVNIGGGWKFHAPAVSSGLEAVVTVDPSVPVRDAVILAAGNGDRFRNPSGQSKLLQPFLGEPLIARTINTAVAGGISSVEIVLGYQAENLRAAVEAHAPRHLNLHFTTNPEWHLENGLSVLAVRERFGSRRFALLMGDHLFDASVLSRLLRERVAANESVLAVDSRPAPPEIVAEATKVRLDGDRITAIGKDLSSFDALDTGLFVCAPVLFEALEVSRAAGDTTLSGGIRALAARGLMRAADIGDATWYDIDTLADLETAEAMVTAPEHA